MEDIRDQIEKLPKWIKTYINKLETIIDDQDKIIKSLGHRIGLQTIKELHDKVKLGEIDEEKLIIRFNNIRTDFLIDFNKTDKNGDKLYCEIEVEEARGYHDIEPLYKLLFPKAQICWC